MMLQALSHAGATPLSDLADTLFKSLGESLGAQAPPSALLIRPLHCTPGTGEIPQRDPGRQLRKQLSSPPPYTLLSEN